MRSLSKAAGWKQCSVVFAFVASALILACRPALAATSICDAVAGNLIANCGFEGSFTTTSIGATIPAGWTANSGYTSTDFNQVVLGPVNSGLQALQIGNFEFQAVPSLSQTFSDTSGQHYNGSLFLNNGGHGNFDVGAFFQVLINGLVVASADVTWPATYTALTFGFTGTGSDTLTIQGNLNFVEWFVDDVSVVSGTLSAVPLPAALPLFASGLVGLGLLGWRRKKTRD